jgi:phosphatidylserine/phosphatidylglycerophosphate/cardiolipin synthase-like enzyme
MMNQDKNTLLKRLADVSRKCRTDLIKSYASRARRAVALGTYLYGHPDLMGWIPEGCRAYVAIGEADLQVTKSDILADPGKYTWTRNELMKQASGHCLLRVIPGHHLKYVLVDPCTDAAAGLLMTCNLTPSGVDVDQAHLARVSSHEMSVELSTKESSDLADLSKFTLFGAPKVREFTKSGLDPVTAVSVDLKKPSELLVNAYGYTSLSAEVISLIESAKSSISLCTYTLDVESPIFRALIDFAKKGKRVVVLMNKSVSNQCAYADLVSAGVKTYMIERMHAKAVLVDDALGIVSTANFCKTGIAEGVNIGVRCNQATSARLLSLKAFFAERLAIL